jgi:uncharacterized protein involved in exopolysaccharide biosynthesis
MQPPPIQPIRPVSATETQDLSRFFAVFATVFLLALIIGTAITFILPETYASTARIKMEQDSSGTWDPYFLQTQCELLLSDAVLTNVINAADLNSTWGKNFGTPLKTVETYEILKNHITLVPVRGTKLMAITVYSDDRNEAAKLANLVAKCYADCRNQKTQLVLLIDQAEPGKYPVKPNKPLNIGLSAVAGAVLGLLAALLASYARRS